MSPGEPPSPRLPFPCLPSPEPPLFFSLCDRGLMMSSEAPRLDRRAEHRAVEDRGDPEHVAVHVRRGIEHVVAGLVGHRAQAEPVERPLVGALAVVAEEPLDRVLVAEDPGQQVRDGRREVERAGDDPGRIRLDGRLARLEQAARQVERGAGVIESDLGVVEEAGRRVDRRREVRGAGLHLARQWNPRLGCVAQRAHRRARLRRRFGQPLEPGVEALGFLRRRDERCLQRVDQAAELGALCRRLAGHVLGVLDHGAERGVLAVHLGQRLVRGDHRGAQLERSGVDVVAALVERRARARAGSASRRRARRARRRSGDRRSAER